MKRIVASVGLVALGAAVIPSAPAQVTPDTSKPWNIGLTLRGFYDDNVNGFANDTSLPSGTQRDSLGFEVSPSVGLAMPMEQTSINASFVYSLKYYENKPINNAENYDQVYSFNVMLNHRFSPRYEIGVRDSFVIGQEPDMLRTGNTYDTFQRVSGDNIRNWGVITFLGEFTPKFGTEIGYANSFFDYEDEGYYVTGADIIPSNSGALDRIDQAVHLDGRWQMKPQTVGVIGYRFQYNTYTADEPIAGIDGLPFTYLYSDARDSLSHVGYLGLDHNFSPVMKGTIRAGAQYMDFSNSPNTDQNTITPYVAASLSYAYAPESSLTAGFNYDRGVTDQVAYDAAEQSFTTDMQNAAFYLALNHRITPKLFGNIIGQIQNSTFNGGGIDGESQMFYVVGLNLQYRFNRHFSAEVGYNYDNLYSEINQSFDRNRVYIGVTAGY